MAQQRYSDQQMEAEIKEGRGRQSVEAVLVRSQSKKLHVPITGVQLTFSTVSFNSTSRETNLQRLGNQQTLNKEVRVSHFRDKIVRKVPSGRQHRAVCAEHGRHTLRTFVSTLYIAQHPAAGFRSFCWSFACFLVYFF